MLDKASYRPVSLLPNISKISEKCMHRQIFDYFEKIFSKFQCGFWKGFSTQDYLLAMVETCKKSNRSRKGNGALLTDLSKVLNCLTHNFVIAKLHSYSFSIESVNLMNDSTVQKQRVKINNLVRRWIFYLVYDKGLF